MRIPYREGLAVERELKAYWRAFLSADRRGNLVDRNTANGNAAEGFVLESCDDNTVTGNIANANGQVGFEVRLGSSTIPNKRQHRTKERHIRCG